MTDKDININVDINISDLSTYFRPSVINEARKILSPVKREICRTKNDMIKSKRGQLRFKNQVQH